MSDIVEIFARDPNQCSKQDIQAIVDEFRKKASLFRSTGDIKVGTTKPKKLKEPGVKLDLSDLGL